MGCLVAFVILADVLLVIENLVAIFSGTASIDDFFSLTCVIIISIGAVIKFKDR